MFWVLSVLRNVLGCARSGHSRPASVRARPGKLRALSVLNSRSVLYGGFVGCGGRATAKNGRFPGRAVVMGACQGPMMPAKTAMQQTWLPSGVERVCTCPRSASLCHPFIRCPLLSLPAPVLCLPSLGQDPRPSPGGSRGPKSCAYHTTMRDRDAARRSGQRASCRSAGGWRSWPRSHGRHG